MSSKSTELCALELCASFLLNDHAQRELAPLLQQLTDWNSFIATLEDNGLAPLFHHHMRLCDSLPATIPKAAQLQIKALVVRHQRAAAVRELAMSEILEYFAKEKIELIALKGLALAYCIYPSASIRPMRDIDLLVPPNQALKAQQALRNLGYLAEDRKEGTMYDHHHLPVAAKVIDGMQLSIEIHHNALSGDVAQSISYSDLTEAPLSFEINSVVAHRLGHIDTLRHLCHHTFEPAKRIKLGSLLDVVRYSEVYQHEIDWSHIKKEQPFIINTLRCIHFVTPLPVTLHSEIDLPLVAAPAKTGEGFQPLSHTFALHTGLKRWQHILHAPAWWAHVFYRVAPEKSLIWVKWIRHPLQIARWLSRRYWALIRAKWAQRTNS